MSAPYTIVVFCNRKDYFLARICVASIRYYYPDVSIYLVKDYLNGYFSSKELEKTFKVKELDLGIQNFGWGAAKVHFLLSKKFQGQPVLILDADIVFAGKFLEELFLQSDKAEFIVNPEYHNQPYSDFVKSTYYNYTYLNEVDPDFKFPGYFFNTGQLLISTGKIKAEELLPYFNANSFPFCKRLDIMPTADQSLLNYILPKKKQKGEIKMETMPFMIWINGYEAKTLQLEKIQDGTGYPFLIHWAGALRIPFLAKMERADILQFFESFYYSAVHYGRIKKHVRKLMPISNYYMRRTYQWMKRKMKG